MPGLWGVTQLENPAAEAVTSAGGRILVALDGSERSAAVLPDAVDLARSTGRSLLLAQALPTGTPPSLARRAGERLARLAVSARARGVDAATALLTGEPVEQLTSYAAGNGVDTMALASRGAWECDGGLRGSVADAIVRRSPVPVLLRRAPGAAGPARPAGLWRLLVPLDGSRLAERALPDALLLARATGARLTLLQVVDDRWPAAGDGNGTLVERELRAAGAYLAELRERCRYSGVPVEATVRLGRPAEMIRWVAREVAADLVVMATHGRYGLQRERLGSVALEVLRGEVPLLLRGPAAVAPWPERRPALRDIPADRDVAV